MPRKKISSDKVQFKGFANVYLSQADRQLIKSNLRDAAGAISGIHALAEAGYKVSFSYTESNAVWTATVYGNHASNPNAGYAMSVRHVDFLTALSAVLHVMDKHGLSEEWMMDYAEKGHDDW